MHSDLSTSQLMLIDEMPSMARNNPLWCSYGPAPNSGYLIDRGGTLVEVQKWLNVNTMETVIYNLLKR